jgi:signal peptidase II
MTFRRPVWPWFTGVAVLLILDQTTKALVRQRLPLHHSVRIIGDDFLRLTHVQNPGILFGADFISLWVLLLFGWVAAVVLAGYLVYLIRRGDVLRWPVALFLTGAIGNSIDRTLFGQVTDFVDVDFPDIFMQRWAVFNVADSCMTVGIALLLILVIFHRGKRPYSAAEAHVETPDQPNSLPTDDRSGPTTAAD